MSFQFYSICFGLSTPRHFCRIHAFEYPMIKKNKKARERSAGGIVTKNEHPVEVLMVQVKNLENKIVWTFPKGHLEKGETSRQAALREVREETGWQCSILPQKGKKNFAQVHYRFARNGIKVYKEVVWFLMQPLKKVGTMDPEEIRKTRWFSASQAARKVAYPSDKKLLSALKIHLRKKQYD